jgi:predicted permease
MATRFALGAAREDIHRQLLIESLIVTSAGTVAALGFGVFILKGLSILGLERMPRVSELHMDFVVVAFTIALAALTGFVIAWASGAAFAKTTWSQAFHGGTRTATAGRYSGKLRRILVASQVGVACLLLIGAGLMLASFRELLRVKPGFTAHGVLTAATQLPATRYSSDAKIREFMDRALTSFRSMPGVVSAGATSHLPFSGSASADVIVPEGYVLKPGDAVVAPRRLTITPGYFESMNIPLVRGRYFDNRDTDRALRAIIVDERLARRFWPGQEALGRRMFVPDDGDQTFKPGPDVKWLTVVGIVPEVRMDDLEGNYNFPGTVYYPYDQEPAVSPFFTVKAAESESIASAVRSKFSEIDAELPLFDVRTMEEITTLSLQSRRTAMFIATAFGIVAMMLSAVGIYGVLAYLVVQRRREIGIRMALGSTVGGIFRLVLREGLTITIAGLAVGLLAATQLRSVIEGEIYGIQPLDPIVLAGAAIALVTIALTACIVPALRASRVDPVMVLHE